MRPDQILLHDIDGALAEVIEFAAAATSGDLATDNLVRSAVLYKLIVVGEAAGRLSEKFRSSHPEVGWPLIISFRNRATHGYFAVDWDLVSDIVANDVPVLRASLAQLLEADS